MLTGARPNKRPRVVTSAASTGRGSSTITSVLPRATAGTLFNDASSADVALRLFVEPSPFYALSCSSSSDDWSDEVQIFLHSDVLRRSKYFAALLSDRWRPRDREGSDRRFRFSLAVTPATGSMDTYLTVLRLLYAADDFSDAIDSVSAAIDILPVALEVLFEDLVKACVRYLEAVPWTEEEERRIFDLVPLLSEEESAEILARVTPARTDTCEEMLHGLIVAAIHDYPNTAFEKAFAAKLLRDLSSRESARRVLERAFDTSLKIMKESLEDYSSPDFDDTEMEAIQRLNLHTALTNGTHLLWLIERMIELRVSDSEVQEWSYQSSFTADLMRAFRDDAWRNIVQGLPAVVLRCTSKLANAVAAGTILAGKQVACFLCSRPMGCICIVGILIFLQRKRVDIKLFSCIRRKEC